MFAYVHFIDVPASAQNQFAWHPSGELHMSMVAGGSVSLDTRLVNILFIKCFYLIFLIISPEHTKIHRKMMWKLCQQTVPVQVPVILNRISKFIFEATNTIFII